ncbi:acylneuraminate cytidylyltransferase family protein [Shinella sp.]|uniref:acylneuraminate cytidylyltransferase family protein n=1 Tax=Shinella sp. TaxID=1870904 RepID=UPI00289AE412|nr:acylneuraminate cytidylyltransferase family protein [Shinella sp.]
MTTYAIVPARSGSKGLPDKNIRPLAGHPLLSWSIAFARALGVDRVICSTDSEQYAEIARSYGAEVPFLRSADASSDTAMEEDILRDFAVKFPKHGITQPELLVWLRPTFVFRDIDAVRRCIDVLESDSSFTAARTVCESEGRLYRLEQNGRLSPEFDDMGKSMIRRQALGQRYKVFSTDIIRFDSGNINDDFLGRNVYGISVDKFCGLDIDDIEDFQLIEALMNGNRSLVDKYLFLN